MLIASSNLKLSIEVLDWVNKKVSDEKIILKLVSPRARKLGDYRYYVANKSHQITINNDLTEEVFFLTFLHELAHKKTFDLYGRSVLPHGAQWKSCFQQLLAEGVEITKDEKTKVFLKESIIRPKASIRIKDDSYNGLTVADLHMNDIFELTATRKKYILKEKRRTRYKCFAKNTNKEYSISSDAQVTKCN